MGTLRGVIRDSVSGEPVEAKVHVLTSSGNFVHPGDSILKVGPGDPFFYSSGEFTVNVPRGSTDIIVERGTEYEPLRKVISMPQKGAVEVELHLKRWIDLPAQHWYPGNTHLHYSEQEARPDDRLHLDPKVHDLSVTVVSILQRHEIPYASNKYPIGFMTDYSTAHHLVDCGEENRHNYRRGGMAYGHIMLLRIRNLVEPVSRGDLVSDFDPDYPPLCYACDDAKRQGGIVLWCHNGIGMEAPVAAALGKLDAFNLFDPYWMDPEYDVWYHLLNCGIPLPASTGTDWFICSNNRVYVQTDSAFTYENWLRGLQAGNTFITNGPALFLNVDGQPPGGRIRSPNGAPRKISGEIAWQSNYPINRVELIHNGRAVQRHEIDEASTRRNGKWGFDVEIKMDGWIAARTFGDARDSFAQAIYAHTSPVYIGTGRPDGIAQESAALFVRSIDDSIDWVSRIGKFTKDAHREEVLHLFREGRKVYAGLAQ
ncbi:MAG: CehA/McbA family metallohydrolase [Candidatus Poribacteria bacterium]|nr:CehA/McbA family metallohydrolase [Candidatus Poribacteria bacterium]